MMEFLNLKELIPLSEQDINVDLHELRGFLDDSDSSVSSSEVLTSHYPVKPRKGLAARRDTDLRTDEFNLAPTNGRELPSDKVDEALAFLKTMASKRKDLMEAEANREELESLLESYNWNYEVYNQQYSEQKQELGAYFRALQGMFLRSLKSYTSNRTYFLSMNKMYEQLTELSQCNNRTHEALTTVKNKMTSKPKRGSPLHNDAAHPLIMKISITGTEKVVTVVVGQRLITPYGTATVSSFDLPQQKATLSLDFGQLFTSIPELTVWMLKMEHQLGSVTKEVKKINDDTVDGFQLQGLFVPATFPVSVSEASNGIDNKEKEDSKEDGSIDEKATTSEMEVVSNTAGTEASGKEDTVSEDMEVPTPSDSEENAKEAVPWQETATIPVPDHVMQIIDQNQLELFRKRAILAVAPFDSLPSLIKHLQATEVNPINAQIALDKSAMDPVTLLRHRNSSRIISKDELLSQQQEMSQSVEELETKERHLVTKLERIRSEGSKLSSMIANMRLGMFTRRIAHRNYLNSKGFATNLFLPTTNSSRGGFKGNNGNHLHNSSSNAASALLSMSVLANAAATASNGNVNGASKGEGSRGGETRRSGKGKGKGTGDELELASPNKQDIYESLPTNGESKKRGREELDKDSEMNDSNAEDNNTSTTGTTAAQKKKARRKRY